LVTWSLLVALGVVGLIGLRNLIRSNREHQKQTAILRLYLQLLDIIREAQVVLESVRRSDFNSWFRLQAIRDRLNYLLTQLSELQTRYEQVLEQQQLPPDEVLEEHIPLARTSLVRARDQLNKSMKGLRAASKDKSH